MVPKTGWLNDTCAKKRLCVKNSLWFEHSSLGSECCPSELADLSHLFWNLKKKQISCALLQNPWNRWQTSFDSSRLIFNFFKREFWGLAWLWKVNKEIKWNEKVNKGGVNMRIKGWGKKEANITLSSNPSLLNNSMHNNIIQKKREKIEFAYFCTLYLARYLWEYLLWNEDI